MIIPAAAASGGAGIFTAGYFANPKNDVDLANGAIAAAKPAKQLICDAELPKPHSPCATASLKSYCAMLPSDVVTAADADFKAVQACLDVEKGSRP